MCIYCYGNTFMHIKLCSFYRSLLLKLKQRILGYQKTTLSHSNRSMKCPPFDWLEGKITKMCGQWDELCSCYEKHRKHTSNTQQVRPANTEAVI